MAVAGSAVVAASVMECRSSSSSAFGSVKFAPVARGAGAVKVNATVCASASEEPKAVRQAMVGLLAAGAILVSGVPAFALTGPGGDGAATTAKEADVLLNKADDLTNNDSPKRFKEGVQDAGSTAKQAGSATASNVKNIADSAVTNAKENLAKAKASFGNVIPKDKVSDASSAMNQTFQVSDASSAINDAKSSASSAVGDAKSSASNAAGDAKNLLSSLGDKLTGNSSSAGDVASDVQNKASNAVNDAKSNLPNLPNVSLPEKKAGQNF